MKLEYDELIMAEVTLIYPYFNPPNDRSIFRFPPLGLGYIASYLRAHGTSVEILDCTFNREKVILNQLRKLDSPIVGIYSMYTITENSLRFAKLLREKCDLLVVGGPLPTIYPELFLKEFDIVVRGEGEKTMMEIVEAKKREDDLSKVQGIIYKRDLKNTFDSNANSNVIINPQRKPVSNLDSLPFPARDLFDNEEYKRYYKMKLGYTTTSIMSSRGCPFNCDFCSKPVFGDVYRARSARNVVDEIEDVLSYGYDRVFFQDDCFTLDQKRVSGICDEITQRKLKLSWECLSRVDSVNYKESSKMKEAGCYRIFFGIESGNNELLQNIIKKGFTPEQAKKAVETTRSAGINTGAFFILGYPGETNETILETIHFAISLPLDYLSFTLPYPIPGTGLYRKVEKNLKSLDPGELHHMFIDHKLNFRYDFSESKLKFGIAKGLIQFEAKKHLKRFSNSLFYELFDILTNVIFKCLR